MHCRATANREPIRVALAIGVAVAIATTEARASNEDSYLYGDQAALTGGAVVASIRDTAAIWYNPAGLALNARNSIKVNGTVGTFSWRKIPDGLAFDLPTGRVQGDIQSQQFNVVPTTLALSRQLRPGLSIGVGLFVTESDTFDFERALTAADRTARLDSAGALTGTLVGYHAGPSIGYQATKWLRIGASVFGVYEDYHEFRKLFVNATMVGTYQTAFLQRLVDIRTTRYGSDAVVGAQVEAGGGWQLGLAVRSPRLIFSEAATTDDSTALIAQGAGAQTIGVSAVDHTPIGAEGTGFTRPPRFVGGAVWKSGPVELSGEGDVSPAGHVPAAANAVWNVRSGLLWQAWRSTALGFGVFTDRSAAGTPASFPDYRVDYYGVAAGWKRTTSVGLKVGESATTLVFSTTIAARYAFGIGESTRIRFDYQDAPTTGEVTRVANELESVVYHEASIYLGTGLDF